MRGTAGQGVKIMCLGGEYQRRADILGGGMTHNELLQPAQLAGVNVLLTDRLQNPQRLRRTMEKMACSSSLDLRKSLRLRGSDEGSRTVN